MVNVPRGTPSERKTFRQAHVLMALYIWHDALEANPEGWWSEKGADAIFYYMRALESDPSVMKIVLEHQGGHT